MALIRVDEELRRGLRTPFLGTLALLGLLAVSVVLGLTVPFAAAGYVEIGIAMVMVVVVLLTSMELGHESTVVRLFAGLGFFWLAILFGMTMQDYLTR